MATGTLSITLNVAGSTISRQINRTGDYPSAPEVEMPVAQTATLSTRTDDNTGVLTFGSSGHGLTVGEEVDVYWDGGQQYDLTVSDVTGADVTVSAATTAGDALPAQDTSLTACEQVLFNAYLDGDNTDLVGLELTYTALAPTGIGRVRFNDTSNAQVAALELTGNQPRAYDITGGATNPFTGNPITKGVVTHSDTTNTGTLRMVILQDGTP